MLIQLDVQLRVYSYSGINISQPLRRFVPITNKTRQHI